MKINKDRLVQIIKEELNEMNDQFGYMGLNPGQEEEGLRNHRSSDRIREIDAEMALLEKEKQDLLMALRSSIDTLDQTINRGSDEQE